MHHINQSICTESLEAVLKIAGRNRLLIEHRLELRKLVHLLYFASNQRADNGYSESYQALANFKANLLRRRKTKDQTTISKLIEILEPARSVLMSDIAFVFRDEIDDYTQIDFSNARHVELLKVAVDSSISKVSVKQGRPVNKPLDEFFIGLKALFEDVTGKPAVAGAHFDGQPKTHFEKLMYLGYQIIRPAQGYPSALKAYERAISRNS